MGWLGRVTGHERKPLVYVDEQKTEQIRHNEGRLAEALVDHARTVRSVHRDLAEGVLAEVMKGRK